LLARHKEQRRDASRLLVRQDRPYHPFGQQFIKVHVEPGFFLRSQAHRLGFYRHGISKAELVLIFGVVYLPNIGLVGGEV
jgi:hypothetical protein